MRIHTIFKSVELYRHFVANISQWFCSRCQISALAVPGSAPKSLYLDRYSAIHSADSCSSPYKPPPITALYRPISSGPSPPSARVTAAHCCTRYLILGAFLSALLISTIHSTSTHPPPSSSPSSLHHIVHSQILTFDRFAHCDTSRPSIYPRLHLAPSRPLSRAARAPSRAPPRAPCAATRHEHDDFCPASRVGPSRACSEPLNRRSLTNIRQLRPS